MTPNQKLTRTLSGKAVTEVHATDPKCVTVRFGDGATMSVLGVLAPPAAGQGTDQPKDQPKGQPKDQPKAQSTDQLTGHVKMVRESGDALSIELDGGGMLQFTLEDPGGSVLVRDAENTVRYAG